jgi:hypothetical protein
MSTIEHKLNELSLSTRASNCARAAIRCARKTLAGKGGYAIYHRDPQRLNEVVFNHLHTAMFYRDLARQIRQEEREAASEG